MIITLVIDQYGTTNNGTTVTSMRLAKMLRSHGHIVKIVTATMNDEFTYQVKINKLPILYQLAKSQGMIIAKVNKKVLYEAIANSDVVHFLLPFPLQKKGVKIAKKLNIPITAAFHLQPENITYTLHLEKFKFINRFIYKYFYYTFYHHFTHIHCPCNMIKQQLLINDYCSNFHIISNGVDAKFVKKESTRPEVLKEKYLILMIGRYSREKRQDLIIKAINESKYKNKLVLILAGQGPWKKYLQKLSHELGVETIFRFYNQNELLDIINYSDLYVHASDAEIEGISCIEAFSCGLVPIISDSIISATNQFAITKMNLFKNNNYNDLKDKIEYLMENPLIKEELSKEYQELAKNYSLENCVIKLEEMFYQAIIEHNDKEK